MMKTIGIGDIIPEFSLKDQNGNLFEIKQCSWDEKAGYFFLSAGWKS